MALCTLFDIIRRRKEADDMYTVSATDMRKNWSKNLDVVSRNKPLFIRRTRDDFVLSDLNTFKTILNAYLFKEDDNSYTISLDVLYLVENANTKEDAISAMKSAIYEYATDFYNEFNLWSAAPNRKSHIPYIFKALLCDNSEELELNVVA